MKIKYNPKTDKLELTLGRDDYADARQIENMISGEFVCGKCGAMSESLGWGTLKRYAAQSRELLIEAGKQGTYTRAKRDLSDLKFAKLDGFDYAMSLAQRIVDQARMAEDAAKAVKEVERDDGRYGDA